MIRDRRIKVKYCVISELSQEMRDRMGYKKFNQLSKKLFDAAEIEIMVKFGDIINSDLEHKIRIGIYDKR